MLSRPALVRVFVHASALATCTATLATCYELTATRSCSCPQLGWSFRKSRILEADAVWPELNTKHALARCPGRVQLSLYCLQTHASQAGCHCPLHMHDVPAQPWCPSPEVG